ncbi:replication endonuclease [Vibrio parahaemolyticus]|nr:replication endonuclease [Vibrio parahaemolyticus]
MSHNTHNHLSFYNAHEKATVRAHQQLMSEKFLSVIDGFSTFASVKNQINTSTQVLFNKYTHKQIRERFAAPLFFDASEENTRDAGEELCAYVISLMSEIANIETVDSVEFHLELEKLMIERLGEKLAKSFPSALNKKGTLKKTSNATLKRLIDRKTCRNLFNKYVKAELLHDDMRQKNIGSESSEKAKKRQKNKDMGFSAYAGERSIKKRKEQLECRDKYLRSKILENGKSAFEMQKTKAAHFTELYLEMCALEEIAIEKKYTWLFITLTCPSEFHSNPAVGKLCWKGASAKESNEYLQGKWRNLNKSFTKKIGEGLKFGIEDGFGFGKRVVEPHASGCAHWHLMLFCEPEKKEQYKELFRHYFEHKNGQGCDIIEKGFDQNGDRIDGDEASAASYMLKYMTKTNGTELKDGKISDSELVAVDAWKHATRIRSHAPFGYKGVKTKYNDCRKIANQFKELFFEFDYEGSTVSEARTVQRKARKIRKKFFIDTLEKTNVNPMNFSRLNEIRDDVDSVINIIKTSSAKTKKTKSGKMGTDYREFMKRAVELSYDLQDNENRFGEKIKTKTELVSGSAKIQLHKNEFKIIRQKDAIECSELPF